MKLIGIALLSITLLFSASIDVKIRQKSQALAQTKNKIKGINVHLSKLAKSINALKKELSKIDARISRLDKNVEDMTKELETRLKQFQQTKESVQRLTKRHSQLKEQLMLAIARSFSKSLLVASLGEQSEEDLLKEEILKAIQKREDQHLRTISKEYEKTRKELQAQQERLAWLEKQIDELMRKKNELRRLREAKKETLQKLVRQKARYDKELQRLIEQQNTIATILKELQIAKARQEASRSRTKIKVKKYGGYKKSRTVRYRGPKTIAPLKRFIITKRYGYYVDPIYQMRIPSENIELKPLEPNAKVRNVLNGEVVLVKWVPNFKNMVIVQHDGGLITIYANLDKLSPFIKKGRRIKKGTIIGRVSNRLIFEVTKNNAHIDPLDLIAVR